MTRAYDLLALDVDGTLVDWDNNMTPTLREAVRGVAAQGVHVVLSTGRSVPGVIDAADKLGFDDGIAVASNGAVTFSYHPVEVLTTVTFDARETVKLLLDHVPDAAVAVEEIGRGYRINKPFPDGEITGEMILQTVEELVAEPVTRVIIRSPDQSAEEFIELAERLGLHGTNYFVGYTAWLDLAPSGVTKASGLESVASRLGVARSRVLAIGDGRNDLEMLRWAGHGVAMGNAPVEVQDAADGVTETVEHDGVVMELARWF
ncbi:MAG TPA: HAD family hydrolase [Nocardioidaceae bacterium]|nr:HAD family hydrolase [Nocardioidaceae bacterium]